MPPRKEARSAMETHGRIRGGGFEWAAEQERAELSGQWWWVACLLPLIVHAALRDLWAPDEPRYAQVAFEMVERADWFVLHRCGELYPDKPPLYFWFTALCGAFGGWTEFALRVPSLAATAVLAWLVQRLARRHFGRREAVLAPCLFLGFLLVADIGGRAQIDPLLALQCVAALELLTRPLPSSRGAISSCLAAGLCLAAALWTKGPAALVNTGLPLVLGLLFARVPESALVRARGWGVAALLAGSATVAMPVAYAIRLEPLLAQHWLFRQHVARVTSTGQHWGPPFEPLWELPLWTLPWATLVAAGVWLAWRAWRARGDVDRQGLLFVGLWFASLLLFYSLIPPKRPLYLLPAYPAAALLAAHAWAEGERRRAFPAWVIWPAPVLFVVLGAALCSVGLFPRATWERLALDITPEQLWIACAIPGVVLIACGAWAAQSLVAKRYANALHAQIAGWTAGFALVAACLYPAVNARKSARELAEWVAARPERPRELPCVGVQPEGYRFYSRVPAVAATAADLGPALAHEGSHFLALVRDRDYEALDPALREQLLVLHQDSVGSRKIYVVARVERKRGAR
jgi:4-amino-4-deoxy-L-arabinose transferase-like glycosyltransferase